MMSNLRTRLNSLNDRIRRHEDARRAMVLRTVLAEHPNADAAVLCKAYREEMGRPRCIFCCSAPATPGSDYCSDRCAIEAETN